MTIVVKLKKCPFCGGAAKITSHSSCDCCGKAYNGRVECTECDAEVSHYNNDADAVAAWNSRFTRKRKQLQK